MNIRSRATERGLTLVEVLAVIVLLSLLAATLTLGFSGSFGRAKQEIAKTAISQLSQKLEAYRIEKGTWPASDVGLKALSDGFAKPSDAYYVDPGKLLDPWKRPFWLVMPGPRELPYEIVSYGADGEPGGSGENEDVSSASSGTAAGAAAK